MIDFFIKSVKMDISRQMMYKANFIIRMLTLLSFDMIMPFITLLIYMNTRGFSGWSFQQILLFQGFYILITGIDRFFFRKTNWRLSSDVRNGNFDRYLLFPVDTLSYISFTNLGFEHISHILIGLGLIIYSAFNISLDMAAIAIALLFLMSAVLLIIAIQVIQFSIIIRAVEIGRIGELFMTMKRYGEYPVDIYNYFISSVLRYIIPLAVLAHYPSAVLLGRGWNLIAIPVVLVIFILSYGFWKNTLKNYASAGG